MADSAVDKRAVKKLQAVMLLGGTGLIAAGGGTVALFGEGCGYMQLCFLRHGLWSAIEDALKFTCAWGLLVLALWALRWLMAIE